MITPHRDKLNIRTSGTKTVSFCSNGEEVERVSYSIPMPNEYFIKKDEWLKIDGNDIKFIN
jgi:recombinational DNA repair ATPase RecF